jgi:hypothetical protein
VSANVINDSIHLAKLRDLLVEAPSQPGRPAFASAASGLVRAGKHLYVVADDELHLGVFDAEGASPGRLLQILPGDLPLEEKKRKRAKPDFEALLYLPAFGAYAHGALLALGSGSTAHRHRGVLLPLNAIGKVDSNSTRVLDLSNMHAAIAREIGTVNIEGAVAVQDRLLLLQRGNKGKGVNAVVRFELASFCSAAQRSDTIPAFPVQEVRRYDLGAISGVPLGFSDCAALVDGSIVFAAIAEDTKDSYADGPCAGAAIGVIDAQGELRNVACVAERAKVEGIFATVHESTAHLLLVTDADDPSIPAALYSATLPL